MEGEEDWKYNDTRCVERLIFFNSRILKGFVSNGGGRKYWRMEGSKGGSSGNSVFHSISKRDNGMGEECESLSVRGWISWNSSRRIRDEISRLLFALFVNPI